MNNQETDRFRVSAEVSERALREIYLPAFEYIVRRARPWSIMCSYNRINGVHASQNSRLLTDILRKEWGFDGMVVSDWGAVHDRVAAINAGLNLEMPPSGTDQKVVEAAHDGKIASAQLQKMAQEVVDLIHKVRPAMEIEGYHYNRSLHHEIAREAARESMVLLRNQYDVLPLNGTERVAVVGEFARTPRYQGSGSSRMNPTHVDSFLSAAMERGINLRFEPGFTLDSEEDDPVLVEQAVDAARMADVILLFLGLPDDAESEGFDRQNITLPLKQLHVLDEIHKVNENIVVVLSNGSVVSIAGWAHKTTAIIESWLLGQAGGEALVDVLYGLVSPSGKLAQTIPNALADDPSFMNWPGFEGKVIYGEDVYVGYRYYDTFRRDVAYPFGFGLSYANFSLTNIQAHKNHANRVHVELDVNNTSSRAGAEVVQVYVKPVSNKVSRPSHELKGFAKVWVEPFETEHVTIDLEERAFAYWSEREKSWKIDPGEYCIEVGTSSRDIVANLNLLLEGTEPRNQLDEWSSLAEWRADPFGKKLVEEMEQMGRKGSLPILPDGDMAANLFRDTLPLNSLTAFMGPSGKALTQFLIEGLKKYKGGSDNSMLY